jgi:hypothetical protein
MVKACVANQTNSTTVEIYTLVSGHYGTLNWYQQCQEYSMGLASKQKGSIVHRFFSRDAPNEIGRIIYSWSRRSLFILAIFWETLRSIVWSPISTIRPPLISGFTCELLAAVLLLFGELTYLWHNLQLLALSDIRRLRDGVFQLLDDFVVKWLSTNQHSIRIHLHDTNWTYRSACDNQLDLAPVSAHELAEVFGDRFQSTQPVVVR